MIESDNALGTLSDEHPDGWGVAFYVDGAPHITRSPQTALGDQLFHRVSGVVSSETVLAHVRRATVGDVSVLNCHPFQHGKWTFAHNGEIKNFSRHRQELLSEIAPRLKRFILGDTDSEVIFYLFLTHLSMHGPLSSRLGAEETMQALRTTIQRVRAICDGSAQEEQASLTIIVTDGVTLAATQGGKELYWSSHKTECGDRDRCPHLAPECEAPSRTGFVNHLVISSEPSLGENVWQQMHTGEIIGIDWQMRMQQGAVHRRQLSVLAS